LAVIGYARVSTSDQNPQLQLDALNETGAVRIFTDHGVSGSTTSRPQLDACLDHLREGDVLAVWKLDRLAAPPCIATSPMVGRSLRDFTRSLLRRSSSKRVRGVGVTSTCSN
jgi:DNA invertase Pin-like site-specific DNA recombinase